ncbi:MAG: hypothetical protein V4659_09290 [Pseudomonadota bacterium]
MTSLRLLLPLSLMVAGCATRPAPTPVAIVAPPPAPVAAPAYAGNANLRVPPRLPDGSYATPNRLASPAAAVWHLRAGLNVAALSCRGSDEAALVAGYNALLATHRAEFAAAYRALTSEYGNAAAFDGAMTALYNYYALPPAQPGLCTTALALLAEAASIPPGSLAAFTPGALARLDQPYVALFAAQEQWLATRYADRAVTAAAVAAVAAPLLVADLSILNLP